MIANASLPCLPQAAEDVATPLQAAAARTSAAADVASSMAGSKDYTASKAAEQWSEWAGGFWSAWCILSILVGCLWLVGWLAGLGTVPDHTLAQVLALATVGAIAKAVEVVLSLVA